VTEAVGLDELATWLAKDKSEGGLGCTNALNLDGGPSTQLSLKAGSTHWELGTEREVPSALGVFSRE